MNQESLASTTEQPRKIVVIGGTGLIGANVVRRLTHSGHNVVVASPSRGVNTLTSEGLEAALAGAHTVIDLSNSPSFEEEPVMHFFATAGRNLAAAEAKAGVQHHVALSVVGTDRMQASPYFRAKLVQEELIKGSGIPYTIVRATQFFEFIGTMAAANTAEGVARVAPVLLQPIAADDVAAWVTRYAVAQPENRTVDLAGPEQIRMDDLVRRWMAVQPKPQRVETTAELLYSGTPVDDQSLVPLGAAEHGATQFAEWLSQPEVRA